MPSPDLPPGPKSMPLDAVLHFLALVADEGIDVWVDGGWGVDALLREQTRDHGDLDIAVERKHVGRLRTLLEADGFRDVPRDDTSPWNYVLGNEQGHGIDVHVIDLDADGNGVLGPPANGNVYPARSLTGSGVIGDRTVSCIHPEDAVRFHCEYEPDDDDFHDVRRLCDAFGIPLPSEYAHFL